MPPALLLAALAAGCRGALPNLCDGGTCPTPRTVSQTFQTTVNRNLDVLFVIDDTAAIAAHSKTVAAGMAEMATVLSLLVPTLSLHLGVVAASTCASTPKPFIVWETCGQYRNFEGTLEAALTAAADFGAGGCEPAAPLAAIERALASPPAGWQGFLRPEAYLAIVVIAAQDDTATPVARTINFVKGLKDDPAGKILVSVIGPPDCDEPTSLTAPQLTALVQSFGGNGLYYGLCNDHYGPALSNLRGPQPLLGPMCLEAVRDVDPATPGLQADCTVDDRVSRGDVTNVTSLRSCDVAPPPCWRLSSNSNCAPDRVAVIIEREPSFCPDGTSTHFECVAQLN